MDEDGIEKFYKSINVDASSEILFFLISMHMQAEYMGEYK